jgi:hypothetical protein
MTFIGRNASVASGVIRCQWIGATAAGVLLLSLGWLESSLAFAHTQLVPWRSGLVSNSLYFSCSGLCLALISMTDWIWCCIVACLPACLVNPMTAERWDETLPRYVALGRFPVFCVNKVLK